MTQSRKPAPQGPKTQPPRRVVYLFGAGATHACVEAVASSPGVLMAHLTGEIAEQLRTLPKRYRNDPSVTRFANEVMTSDIDIEQVITFLDESGSGDHQRLARDLRNIFQQVLQRRLKAIKDRLSDTPSGLYAALIAMHEVQGTNETLQGILTLNYDLFLEHAIEKTLRFSVDHGIGRASGSPAKKSVKVLKLHGSFGWRDVWPIESRANADTPLWIPPGIQKARGRYPFNLLWGMARKMLDCDVLRIAGCNVSMNDSDLVSMLFSTQHAHHRSGPYEIELIGRPPSAQKIKSRFPYLTMKSLLEIEVIGEQIVAELMNGKPCRYHDLEPAQQEKVFEESGNIPNPLWYWLKQKAETMYRDIGSLKTKSGEFERLLESHS